MIADIMIVQIIYTSNVLSATLDNFGRTELGAIVFNVFQIFSRDRIRRLG